MFTSVFQTLARLIFTEKSRFSPARQRQRNRYRPIAEVLEDRLAPATLPTGFTETVIASGLSSATAMEIAPDSKLFIAEQAGTMEVWQNGSQLRVNFFQNTPLTVRSDGERGLLGIAFDPNYAANRFVYVYYTTTLTDAHNRVSRFTANAAGDLALAGSEVIIWEGDPHAASNHNGGGIHFGPDGKLYIATGDNALGTNAQSFTSLHGKMLRINPDGTIPADNPFVAQANGKYEAIWAMGLRNPFTFAFRPGTGQMFINDVGQNTWEEIDNGLAGANYGWPSTEGSFNQGSFPNFKEPFFTYDHGGNAPNGIAITGGAFYNPATNQFPSDYTGDYFFADYGGNWIYRIDTVTAQWTTFATNAIAPVDLKVDGAGNLLYLARGSNQVFKVSYTANPAPAITQQPVSRTVAVSQSATFTVVASGAAPLNYQWERNNGSGWNPIGGANAASYTISNAQLADSGAQFHCIVTNGSGTATSGAASLTVTVNQPPAATIAITGGLRNGKWDAGTAIGFSGLASDPEDGNVPVSRFTWEVNYLTTIDGGDSDADGLPGITRPYVQPFGNTGSSSFTPAVTGPYTLTDVAYVITLAVTDSLGLTDVERLVIYPNTVTLNVQTNPANLEITVDAQPFTGPQSFASVVGFQRPIGVTPVQSLGGTSYSFATWSDGGAATHTITTPATNTTYTATFGLAPGTGTGLMATYFDNVNFTGATVVRRDATVNFNWPGVPVTGIGADTFSVRWVGQVQPRFTQTYTFYTTSDDGVRLWVNNQLIINNWTSHSPTVNAATLALTAGTKYDIKMEFFDNTVGAVAKLEWQSASQVRQVIPQAQLYTPTPVLTSIAVSPAAVTLANDATRQFSAVAYDQFGQPLATQPAFTWSLLSGIGAITPDGIYSAPSNGTGKAVVQAVSDTLAGTATVTVSNTAPGLKAEFFDYTTSLAALPDLTGKVADVTRTDSQINYAATATAWTGLDSRFVDTFASRHTGMINISTAGNYTFYLASNEGSKLWLDGQLLINNDGLHAFLEKSATVNLTSGYHDLRVEFFENTGNAGLQLSWSGLGIVKQIVPASVLFQNLVPVTLPAAPSDLAATSFSSSRIDLTWTDNSSNETSFKIERATDAAFTQNLVTTTVGAGVTSFHAAGLSSSTTYYFRVRASNSAGDSDFTTASAATLAGPPVGGGDGLAATYFDNLNFTGKAISRIDPTVNFNWGTGAPVAGIAADTFSVRWTGKIQPLYTETYTFFTTRDDGIRLTINGQLLIDQWNDHSPITQSATIALTAGVQYDILLEYYDNTGGAVAKLEWQSASQVRQVVPQSQLFSQ